MTIVPLHLVGDDVARDEGEGFVGAAEWRSDHVAYWNEVTNLVRSHSGDPTWQLREAEPVVVHWFRLIKTGTAPGPVNGIPVDDRQPVRPDATRRPELALCSRVPFDPPGKKSRTGASYGDRPDRDVPRLPLDCQSVLDQDRGWTSAGFRSVGGPPSIV